MAGAAKKTPDDLGNERTTKGDLLFLALCGLAATAVTFGTLLWGNRNGFLLVPLTYMALGALIIKKGV